jgi:hypothetical protein
MVAILRAPFDPKTARALNDGGVDGRHQISSTIFQQKTAKSHFLLKLRDFGIREAAKIAAD